MPTSGQSDPCRSYLWWFFVTTLASVLLAGAFNVIVDPLNIFGTPRLRGFNLVKPHLDHHRELTRWRQAQRQCPTAVILGNSRAEIGFDPEHPAFAQRGLNAVNQAVPGTDAVTAYRQLRWLQSIACMPKLVVLGVEFFDFLGNAPPRDLATLAAAPPPGLDAAVLAEVVFSLTSLGDAMATVALQHASYPATLTERGFNPLRNYLAEVAKSGHQALFRQRAVENAKMWARKPRQIHPAGAAQSEDAQAVQAILGMAQASGSQVHLVIYPYHAQMRLMMAQMGLSELFNDWKRDLVLVAGQAAARPGARSGAVSVWDFSGLSPYTQEPIPAAADRLTALQYFWEAGHFKKALGDQVLSTLLGAPTGLGMRLDAQNLPAWLAQDQASMQRLLSEPSALRDFTQEVLRHAGVVTPR